MGVAASSRFLMSRLGIYYSPKDYIILRVAVRTSEYYKDISINELSDNHEVSYFELLISHGFPNSVIIKCKSNGKLEEIYNMIITDDIINDFKMSNLTDNTRNDIDTLYGKIMDTVKSDAFPLSNTEQCALRIDFDMGEDNFQTTHSTWNANDNPIMMTRKYGTNLHNWIVGETFSILGSLGWWYREFSSDPTKKESTNKSVIILAVLCSYIVTTLTPHYAIKIY